MKTWLSTFDHGYRVDLPGPVVSAGCYASSISYASSGHGIKSMTLENWGASRPDYNSRLQPTTIKVTNNASQVLLGLTLGYCASGLALSECADDTGTVRDQKVARSGVADRQTAYSYDGLNRLKGFAPPEFSCAKSYCYDAIRNLLDTFNRNQGGKAIPSLAAAIRADTSSFGLLLRIAIGGLGLDLPNLFRRDYHGGSCWYQPALQGGDHEVPRQLPGRQRHR